jgi:hypothetical protein
MYPCLSDHEIKKVIVRSIMMKSFMTSLLHRSAFLKPRSLISSVADIDKMF